MLIKVEVCKMKLKDILNSVLSLIPTDLIKLTLSYCLLSKQYFSLDSNIKNCIEHYYNDPSYYSMCIRKLKPFARKFKDWLSQDEIKIIYDNTHYVARKTPKYEFEVTTISDYRISEIYYDKIHQVSNNRECYVCIASTTNDYHVLFTIEIGKLSIYDIPNVNMFIANSLEDLYMYIDFISVDVYPIRIDATNDIITKSFPDLYDYGFKYLDVDDIIINRDLLSGLDGVRYFIMNYNHGNVKNDRNKYDLDTANQLNPSSLDRLYYADAHIYIFKMKNDLWAYYNNQRCGLKIYNSLHYILKEFGYKEFLSFQAELMITGNFTNTKD